MAEVRRYNRNMIDTYVEGGSWTHELTVDFWERNADLHPDTEALVDSNYRLTWAQAVQMTHRLAAALLDFGLKKDDVLLCQLHNCVPLTITRLACEKAGVLVALVGPRFRETEIGAVLKQTQAVAAVFPAEFRRFRFFEMYDRMRRKYPHFKHLIVFGDNVPRGGMSFRGIVEDDTVLLDRDLDRQKFGPFEFTEITTTSGSTGIPKCVEWTACARLATGREYIKGLQLGPQDVIAAVSPSISGSAETLIHRTPPQVGAKTVMLEHFSPEETCRMIEKEKVTGMGAVPTHLVRLVGFQGLKDYDLSSLRFIQVSGGLLPFQIGAEAERLLGCKVVQGYGGMDIGAVAAAFLDAPQEVRLRSVGRPLRGNELTLIDPDTGKEVPRGDMGVVTVEGPHCVGGYFKNPQADAESRVHGKFNMGDLGVLDENGYLFLSGRVKDVIIRGGQTIYPSEVEDLLVQHPKVSEAALVRMEDSEMGERACAFVVPAEGEHLTLEEIVAFFRDRQIAVYKTPERLELIEALPMVSGGNKVNKRELEDMLKAKIDAEEDTY